MENTLDFVVIGISGKAGSGKSLSRILIEEFIEESYPQYEFKHLSFAAKLKDIAYEVFAWSGDKTNYPEEDIGRRLLINIGTKMREIRASVWVDFVADRIKNDIVLEEAHNKIYVIDDLRFQNEVAILRENFGHKFFWVQIKRDGVEEVDSHSERDLDSCADYDAIVKNTTLEQFKVAIKGTLLLAIERMRGRIHAQG